MCVCVCVNGDGMGGMLFDECVCVSCVIDFVFFSPILATCSSTKTMMKKLETYPVEW